MTSSDTRCIDPAQITADDRIAYAQAEASPAAIGHIERCAFCRNEAEAYRVTGRVLEAGLARLSCLPVQVIQEYVLGMLEPEETQSAAAHLLDCAQCLAESRAMSEFLREPDEPAAQGILGTLRRLVALPIAPRAGATAGLRGAPPDAVTYEAEEYLVRVSIQSSTPGRRGRVLAGTIEQRSGEVVEGVGRLMRESSLIQSQDIEDFGSFLFNDIPPGSYSLELTTGDTEIAIRSIEVS